MKIVYIHTILWSNALYGRPTSVVALLFLRKVDIGLFGTTVNQALRNFSIHVDLNPIDI